MTAISYFQRFSQKENHVTNNTLLVIRHLYRSSPRKVSLLLNALLEEEVSVGIEFQQQIRGTHSVPDALITQQPLSIFFEAKLGGLLDGDQILRHAESIKSRNVPNGSAILIGLTSKPLSSTAEASLREKVETLGVRFFTVTYTNLVIELRKLCAEHEQDLIEIIEDYRSFLAASDLLSNPDNWMVAFPCGTSWAENIRFGVYFEPASRSSKGDYPFLGIYHDKKISHIGRIISGAVLQLQSDNPSETFGQWKGEHLELIRQIIAASTYYTLTEVPHRYYIVDKFVEANFHKKSPGGMQGHRYFDLSQYTDGVAYSSETSAQIVANALQGKSFE